MLPFLLACSLLLAAHADPQSSRRSRDMIFFPTDDVRPASDRFSIPGIRQRPVQPSRSRRPVQPPTPPPTEPPTPAHLDLPEDIDDLDQLDSLTLTSLNNNVSSIEDFLALFGLEEPEPEDAPQDFASSNILARFGGPDVTADTVVEQATMAFCKPELRTIPLELPSEAGAIYFPTCVRMERCGGCCHGHGVTCTPTKTQLVELKVIKSNVQSNAVSRRRRRSSAFHHVEVERHLACECGCKTKLEDCNPAIHSYRESECACVCKDRDERAKCESENALKTWSEETCECQCRRTQQCGNGEFFDQDTCSCEPISGLIVARLGIDQGPN